LTALSPKEIHEIKFTVLGFETERRIKEELPALHLRRREIGEGERSPL